MKHLIKYTESVINNKLTNTSQEIIDYLETWPDEYDDFKFKFKEIKTIIASNGLIIQVEYVLPEILWRNQDFSSNMLLPRIEKNIDYIDTQILIWNRLKTLLTRLELLGGSEVKYKDATFLSQRTKSIYVSVFINSDTL